ncbi:MAG: hypothetical protein PHO10_04720 [Gemmiger sp.]|nr:hypothetical protein [Gemmiger sp.]
MQRHATEASGNTITDINLITPVTVNIKFRLLDANGNVLNAAGNVTSSSGQATVGNVNITPLAGTTELTVPLSTNGTLGTAINLVPLLKNLGTAGVRVEATVTMAFGDGALKSFPESSITTTNTTPTAYVQLATSARLSANASTLASGTLTTGTDPYGYYRDKSTNTSLVYNVAGSVSQLGINLSDPALGEDSPVIHTAGYYNISGLEDKAATIAKATGLQCTLELLVKNAKDEYETLAKPGEYITVNAVDPGSSTISTALTTTTTDGKTVYTWAMNKGTDADPFGGYQYLDTSGAKHPCYDATAGTFTLPFDVIVNPKVEEGILQYANYRINLTVSLVGPDGETTVLDTQSDYLKYTLARISTTILRQNPTTP